MGIQGCEFFPNELNIIASVAAYRLLLQRHFTRMLVEEQEMLTARALHCKDNMRAKGKEAFELRRNYYFEG